MAHLVLGPILRHVGQTDATVWVETTQPCEVEVLGHTARTFAVEGHHYALVCIDGLAPGARQEYEVALDGEVAWPQRDSALPPSVIRTLGHPGAVRVAFGSCRVALPHEPPYTLPKDADPRGRGPDALQALALRLIAGSSPPPDVLVMLGDQIYADEVSPGTREFIRRRRGLAGPHGDDAEDFEDYHHLYLDAWGEPTIRWLLSTVPAAGSSGRDGRVWFAGDVSNWPRPDAACSPRRSSRGPATRCWSSSATMSQRRTWRSPGWTRLG